MYPFRHLGNDVKHSRPRAPESRAAASESEARASSLPEADITLAPLWKNSASVNVCGEETFFLWRRAVDEICSFPEHKPLHLFGLLTSATPKKHKPESFSEGGFVRFPSIFAWQLYSSARGFRIYHCSYCISRTRIFLFTAFEPRKLLALNRSLV